MKYLSIYHSNKVKNYKMRLGILVNTSKEIDLSKKFTIYIAYLYTYKKYMKKSYVT